MTDPQQPQRPGDFACPYSAGSEFDQALRQVQGLLQEGKLEPALDLLLELEKKYIQAVRLFDLLADVLLRSGQIKPGIRYKTLHEILRGTYKIAKEEMRVDGTIDSGLRFRPGASPTGEGAIEFVPVSSGEIAESGVRPGLYPLTAAMGLEFMRQGHFRRAFEIFDELVRRNPDDQALREARERALKKDRSKQVMELLQRWVARIEQMKSEQSLES
jgi:tetratricopeptide (TPR) repeat protein